MVALHGHGNGKSPDPLGDARGWLAAAVKLAGPAADAGDARGAHELFACTLRLALVEGKVSPAVEKRLGEALAAADAVADPAGRAAVYRATFRQLLGNPPEPDPDPDADPLDVAQDLIETAISIGAPAYNAGDHHGCYETYACTARLILGTLDDLPDAAADRLAAALEQAVDLEDVNRRAWAMRHGFDAVLGLGGPDPAPVAPADVVPIFLKLAIQIGAPAYNAGDHRGCYEVYACVARMMLRTVAGGEAAKASLKAALQDCALTSDVTEQAWTMRRAFDAIIAAADAPPPADEDEDDAGNDD